MPCPFNYPIPSAATDFKIHLLPACSAPSNPTLVPIASTPGPTASVTTAPSYCVNDATFGQRVEIGRKKNGKPKFKTVSCETVANYGKKAKGNKNRFFTAACESDAVKQACPLTCNACGSSLVVDRDLYSWLTCDTVKANKCKHYDVQEACPVKCLAKYSKPPHWLSSNTKVQAAKAVKYQV